MSYYLNYKLKLKSGPIHESDNDGCQGAPRDAFLEGYGNKPLNGEKLTNASTIEHWLDTYTPKWVKTASVKQRTTYELITLKHLKRIIQTVTGFANETMETSAFRYQGELENLRLMTINALPRRP